MARKLASIQTVSDVIHHPNADRLDICTVLGWKVITKRDEFKPQDLCVFCEIDSILPPKPEFDFLKKNKYRVKTIRLRGELSQGICFTPTDVLSSEFLDTKPECGTDVTDLMDITKYMPPLPKSTTGGQTKGNFPGYVIKTDEPRIQSNLGILEELRGVECYSTVKIDGTSFTAARLNEQVDVCSRTRSIKDSEENVYWRIVRKYDILEILKHAGNVAIQGEIAGWWQEGRSTIQGNPLGLTKSELFVFNVFDIKEGKYLDFADLVKFCDYYRLPMVPVEHECITLNHTLDELLEMAKGNYPNGNVREGLVFRPLTERVSVELKGRASFKVINNDYLLKHGDR